MHKWMVKEQLFNFNPMSINSVVITLEEDHKRKKKKKKNKNNTLIVSSAKGEDDYPQ